MIEDNDCQTEGVFFSFLADLNAVTIAWRITSMNTQAWDGSFFAITLELRIKNFELRIKNFELFFIAVLIIYSDEGARKSEYLTKSNKHRVMDFANRHSTEPTRE